MKYTLFSNTLILGLALTLAAGCSTKPAEDQAQTDSTQMANTATDSQVSVTDFGKTEDGQTVQLYTLTNAGGAKVQISNYGGTVVSLQVPDKDGKLGEVVLGFDSVSGYQSAAFRKSNPYFGALIGRYGNRIKGGKFTLDGQTYQLPQNNGKNSLHGGDKGFDRLVWKAEPGRSSEGPTLDLTLSSAEGDQGYPGKLDVKVTYTWTDANELKIDYEATTDKATVVNLTNHAYFNLNAGSGENVLGHEVVLAADRYTDVDGELIPTGLLKPVKGTTFDFNQPHTIGERIGQVKGGYDHNWCLSNAGKLHAAASVYEPQTGRTMEVLTDEPGLQFYTGNFLNGSLKSRGLTYGQHAGFCMETQHYPDSPNQPSFPSTTLKPGETYKTSTVYRFGVRK